MPIGRNPNFMEIHLLHHHHHHFDDHHHDHHNLEEIHPIPGMPIGFEKIQAYGALVPEMENSTSIDDLLPIISIDSSAEGPDVFKSWSFYLVIFGGTCLSLFTILGNLMVLLSFKMDRGLQTISNYFLISLACADLFVGVISIPFMTYYTALGSWEIGYTLCQFWLCMDYLMSNASVMNLLLISFDRFFSVTRPLTYRPKRTSNKVIFAIIGTFVVSALLWPPWIIGWPYIDGQVTVPQGTCYIQFLETSPFITVLTSFAAFWCPVSIMIILYCRVYSVAKSRRRIFAKPDNMSAINYGSKKNQIAPIGPTNEGSMSTITERRLKQEMKKSENKAAKTLLAIMLAFIITWLPYDVIVLWEIFRPHTTPGWMWSFAYALCYVNSALNPICYALGNPQYRQTYIKILRCQFHPGTALLTRRSTVEDKI